MCYYLVMSNKNAYVNLSKISEVKFRQILKLFCLDLNANQIAQITCLNRITVNRYLMELRKAAYCEQTSPMSGRK